VVRAAELPHASRERETLLRLVEREAALGARAVYVELDDTDSAEVTRAAIAFSESLQCLLFVGSREPLRLRRRAAFKLEVANPTTNEQLALWRDSLGPLAEELDGHLERVTSQFSLGQLGIYAASLSLTNRDAAASDLGEVLWDACRMQARPRLEELAQRLDPNTTWEDLVLPEQQLAILRELALHGRHRAQVYERWGFAGKCSRGNGTSALFSGVSGTGKTMAAEVLARELKLDLYRIDLSQVVSKYIGETEKNLRRVFDAAESGGVLLLFDEADALFGKRSEVKDSHDRYANIEIGYLLQRMEQYRGLAILTTNMKESLDQAFLRRIRFVVQFPFPDVTQRVEIWRKVFPRATPTDGLDAKKLALLHVTGGNIRNIALNAAFLASEERVPVRMHHLLAAARSECAKLGRQPTGAEVGGWT
jgi:SpoVK/Ycf46/Vps4 family AAA+-type ATPase